MISAEIDFTGIDLEACLRDATRCWHEKEEALRKSDLALSDELERRRQGICAGWKLNKFYHGNGGKAIQNQGNMSS